MPIKITYEGNTTDISHKSFEIEYDGIDNLA